MSLERLRVIFSLEVFDGVEVLERLEHPECQSWAFGCFFRFLTLTKPRNIKIGLGRTYFPLVNDRSGSYLA